MSEEWREVPYFYGYSVSSAGRVRGPSGLILKPHTDASGRKRVDLHSFGRRRAARVHSVVLAAFAGPKPDGCEASHLNGDASDNRAANLTWESHLSNVRRKREHGTQPLGESSSMSFLTEADVLDIRASCLRGEWQKDVAARYGTTQSNVSAIVLRKSWRHVA